MSKIIINAIAAQMYLTKKILLKRIKILFNSLLGKILLEKKIKCVFLSALVYLFSLFLFVFTIILSYLILLMHCK